ncbi:hypothetical protein B0H14DRAFT_3893804 [Mycena olivaceomarginata]|nr:hypothetical protein B0H14DRAFT_3893804 [Mycena olivaceomarginata]
MYIKEKETTARQNAHSPLLIFMGVAGSGSVARPSPSLPDTFASFPGLSLRGSGYRHRGRAAYESELAVSSAQTHTAGRKPRSDETRWTNIRTSCAYAHMRPRAVSAVVLRGPRPHALVPSRHPSPSLPPLPPLLDLDHARSRCRCPLKRPFPRTLPLPTYANASPSAGRVYPSSHSPTSLLFAREVFAPSAPTLEERALLDGDRAGLSVARRPAAGHLKGEEEKACGFHSHPS